MPGMIASAGIQSMKPTKRTVSRDEVTSVRRSGTPVDDGRRQRRGADYGHDNQCDTRMGECAYEVIDGRGTSHPPERRSGNAQEQ